MVHEVDMLRHLVKGSGTLDSHIGDLVESDYATVTPASAATATGSRGSPVRTACAA
jgi:hypothetical protein